MGIVTIRAAGTDYLVGSTDVALSALAVMLVFGPLTVPILRRVVAVHVDLEIV